MASIREQLEIMKKQALKEISPDIDTSQGTAINDIFIKGNMEVITSYTEALESMNFRMSILNMPFLSKSDGDDLMGNIFLTRGIGDKAKGAIRVFFKEAKEITISVGEVTAVNSNRIPFANSQAMFFSLAKVQSSVDNGLFFIDVDLEATTLGFFETKSGEIQTLESGLEGFSRVINKDDFYSGRDVESNINFGLRGEKALTVRNLVNDRSISTVLREEFPWLKTVDVIGYGEKEMRRDQIDIIEIINLINSSPDIGKPVEIPNLPEETLRNMSIGNKMDIYVDRRNLVTHSVTITANETDFISLFNNHNAVLKLNTLLDTDGLPRFKFPIFDILSIQQLNSADQPITLVNEISEELANPTNPNGFIDGFYRVEVLTPKLRYSLHEEMGIRLKSDIDETGSQIPNKISMQGIPLKVTYRYVDGIDEVDDFIRSERYKLSLADPMIKSKFPGFVSVYNTNTPFSIQGPQTKMKVKLYSGKTLDDVSEVITFFMENVTEKLEVTDLIAFLYDQKVVSYVELPLFLRLEIENDRREIEEPFPPNQTRFDLKELEKRHVSFISRIELEEVQ